MRRDPVRVLVIDDSAFSRQTITRSHFSWYRSVVLK